MGKPLCLIWATLVLSLVVSTPPETSKEMETDARVTISLANATHPSRIRPTVPEYIDIDQYQSCEMELPTPILIIVMVRLLGICMQARYSPANAGGLWQRKINSR